MTTKPFSTPWVDKPYKLITTPSTYRDVNEHSAVLCASDMAYAHNCLIRGLNSILLQAPHVLSSSQPGYVEQDVKDLLFYVVAWTKMVHHHHWTEEAVIFPAIEKMSGQQGLLSGPLHQHDTFQDPLAQLEQYATDCQKRPSEYDWATMKSIFDQLAPPLTEHLHDEIDVFLSLDHCDSNELLRCWKLGEDAAKSQGGMALLYDVFPCVLGCCDRTYEGGNQFPPLPSFMPYAIKYWFSTYGAGAWRFLPCDFWCQPRPLVMLPENRGKC